jgi:glycosyltransferase involved in cell wall biosynthesis
MESKDCGMENGRFDVPARILYLIVTLPVGGAEEHLLSLVRNLDRARFSPLICCVGKSGPIGKEIEDAGGCVIELGRLERGGYDGEIVSLLRDVIRREKVSLVHSHLYHANLYGRLAAFREGVPVVCTISNTYVRPKVHRRIINWWLARRTHRIIAGSEAIRNDVVKYDCVLPEKVLVIPWGTDTEKFEVPLSRKEARRKLELPEEGFIVGTVGRLEEQKGQKFLLEAIGRLRRQGKELSLLLIGSGREEERLRETARREGVTEDVQFLGTRRDLPDLFRAMDAFVLSSLWEGLPIALLSAMASGLPIIATPVGGIPEVIRDGENGYLVPPRDAGALAETIWRVREDPIHATSCGAAALRTVREKYSHRRNAQRVMEVYEEVLAR